MKRNLYTELMAAVVVMTTVGLTWGQVVGAIVTDEGKELKGEIRFKAREKAYAIKTGNMEVEWPANRVQEFNIPRPKEMDAAEQQIFGGNPAAAIPTLEKIVAGYTMLKWDEEATRLLASAYLRSGDTEKALRACDSIIKTKPEAAYLGVMAPIYWEALIKANRTTKVEELLVKAIKEGDREASAFALIRRGDIVLAAGENADNAKKALRDGYLRVTLLYSECKAALPEALYKSAKCFDRLGQTGRSDAARSQLKSEFPNSEWARKP